VLCLFDNAFFGPLPLLILLLPSSLLLTYQVAFLLWLLHLCSTFRGNSSVASRWRRHDNVHVVETKDDLYDLVVAGPVRRRKQQRTCRPRKFYLFNRAQFHILFL
jgi:hypothetical protein